MNVDATNELATALAAAQGEMHNPPLDKTNPHFKSKYASLAAVRDAVIPVLSKHGLSFIQMPMTEDGVAGCGWILMHKSGQSIQGELLLPVDKANAQGIGSAITYAKRYTMQSVAGIVGDDDDDGNAASEPPRRKTEPKPEPPPPKEDKPTTAHERIKETLKKLGCTTVEKVDAVVRYVTGGEVTAEQLKSDDALAAQWAQKFSEAFVKSGMQLVDKALAEADAPKVF